MKQVNLVPSNNLVTNSTKAAISRRAYQISLIAVGLLSASLASAGLGSGLDTATTSITELRDKAFIVVGVAAGAYLLWQAVLCWSGKKDWSDMIPAMLHVAIAGSAITLAAWLWTTLA